MLPLASSTTARSTTPTTALPQWRIRWRSGLRRCSRSARPPRHTRPPRSWLWPRPGRWGWMIRSAATCRSCGSRTRRPRGRSPSCSCSTIRPAGTGTISKTLGTARTPSPSAAHGGSTNGQESAFELVPERNFAVTVLTNSGTGLQVNRELVKWAKERYLGLADEEPPTVALDETTLRPFTGRYVSDMSIIDISPSGDGGLTVQLSYPPAAVEAYKAISDEPPEPVPGFTIRMTGDEQYMISDGQYKGMKGSFARAGGRITGINFAGRLAVKQ